MGFGVFDFMVYTIWAVLGLMILDFVIAFIRSFWKGSFSTSLVLNYLKDILYYVFPLKMIASWLPLDPTGWILVGFYFVGGIAIIIKYLVDIKNRFI